MDLSFIETDYCKDCGKPHHAGIGSIQIGKGTLSKLPEELKKLAERVCFDDDVRYCPHGRPVMIEMSRYDLEKQFRRIQS